MKIEVEFISKELIKPSSPSPDHLRRFQLSFLDQIQPSIFIPCVLFYSKNSNLNNLQISNILRQSLRQVLTIFYPLAGRIKGSSYINCNDEGFPFVEAKANCQLSDVLQDRDPYNNKKFIPVTHDDAGELPAFSQITFFNCGGLAISFAVCHMVGDGLSGMMFLSTWAAIARGNTAIKIPSCSWSTHFPPIKMPTFEPDKLVLKEMIVTKMFVFNASTVEALKAKYSVNGVRASRVIALAAFIWSRFMAATQDEQAKNCKVYSVIYGVDLRSRIEPALPKLSFGNLVWFALADMEAKDDDSHGFVKRIKDSIRNMNADSVRKLQNSDEQLNMFMKVVEEYGKKEVVTFSDLCNFPFYNIDFGWGKPLWVGLLPNVSKNLVFFTNSNEGQGIEAYISLKHEDMAKFEDDEELIAHLSSSSSSPNEIQSKL